MKIPTQKGEHSCNVHSCPYKEKSEFLQAVSSIMLGKLTVPKYCVLFNHWSIYLHIGDISTHWDCHGNNTYLHLIDFFPQFQFIIREVMLCYTFQQGVNNCRNQSIHFVNREIIQVHIVESEMKNCSEMV